MDRVAELLADFEALGRLLASADGAAAAAIVRERRILGAELERLAPPSEVSKVDELARRRQSSAGVDRPPSRRRKSG